MGGDSSWGHSFCPPLSRKRGDIKSHSSVCPSVRPSVRPSLCLSVTKTLTLAITFALLKVELSYLACVFFVTRPFRWYHVVTLTVTFDLLQGQICCRAGDHHSLNLLVRLETSGNERKVEKEQNFIETGSLCHNHAQVDVARMLSLHMDTTVI